jgi:hypothetical protein
MKKKLYLFVTFPLVIFMCSLAFAEKPPNPNWHTISPIEPDSRWCDTLEEMINESDMKQAVKDAVNAGGPCDEITKCILEMGDYNPYDAIKAVIDACGDIDMVIVAATEFGIPEAVIAKAVADASTKEEGLAFTPDELGPLQLINIELPGGEVPLTSVSPSNF